MDSSASAIEQVFRSEYGRVVAALAAWSGDLSLAEEMVQEAFTVALETWPTRGVPSNPGAWLTVTARHRAIDRLRRDRTRQAKHEQLLRNAMNRTWNEDEDPPDERLGLIFTCCHPALSTEAQVSLTLRLLGGLTLSEIAGAFVVSEATIARRVTRAKLKIRDAGIPLAVPEGHRLPDRLAAVLLVVYLIFNEGYSASAGEELIRRDLCREAIRLGELLCALMPDEPEVLGLSALMLLQDSRRPARVGPGGELVLLEAQDRTRWDAGQIRRGTALLDRAVRHRVAGPYQLQAAVAALHCAAPRAADTDWAQIAALYGRLEQIAPTPVVALNRAVAIAMADDAQAGLLALERADLADALADYLPFHAARADLLRRAGHAGDAAAAYRRASALSTNAVERAYLAERVSELDPRAPDG